MARTLNKSIDAVGLEESKNRAPEALRNLEVGISLLRESAALLGLFLKPVASSADHSDSAELVDGLMQLIIQIRADARKNKNFDIADTVRDGLNGLGVTLQDLKEGTTWSQE
jgi:cysteinyl-tRNA synthetase